MRGLWPGRILFWEDFWGRSSMGRYLRSNLKYFRSFSKLTKFSAKFLKSSSKFPKFFQKPISEILSLLVGKNPIFNPCLTAEVENLPTGRPSVVGNLPKSRKHCPRKSQNFQNLLLSFRNFILNLRSLILNLSSI